MKIEPGETIIAREGAKISYGGSGTLWVTAEDVSGASVSIEVPENTEVTWFPPAGWTQVTFRAAGQQTEMRYVEW